MMKISVVLTTKNEEKHIGELLDAMVHQEEPHEVIIVDSDSTDRTQQIIKEYIKQNKNIKLFVHPGTRAESMNYGVTKATGDAVAFIGGDDIPDVQWIREIRVGLQTADIVVGKLISKKENRFKTLENVKVFYKGINISYPGTNTTYKKEILDKLGGGYDPWFSSAEDLEMNIRAVDLGYKIQSHENAIVYYRPRNTPWQFLRQSFWYGYGRKLLALKYEGMWKRYSVSDTVKTQFSLLGVIRLTLGFFGYVYCVVTVREYN
ncbi:MAG: glycosyltransferase [Euryarchaeota archaeon]|nr:glycosyltransferase [Euryarchaeota archaeon]